MCRQSDGVKEKKGELMQRMGWTQKVAALLVSSIIYGAVFLAVLVLAGCGGTTKKDTELVSTGTFHLQAATAYHKNGSYEDAISDYDIAIQFGQQLPVSYFNRGLARTSLGQYREAIKDFSFVINREPNNAFAYNSRGLAQYELGKYQEALSDFDEAIRLMPTFAKAFVSRDKAHVAIGNQSKGRTDLENALEVAEKAGQSYLVTSIKKVLSQSK